MVESIFRSAPMCLIQLYVPHESAREVLAVLGMLGIVHLRDLNGQLSGFQRPFVVDARRIDEAFRVLHSLERDLESIHALSESQAAPNLDTLTEPPASASDFAALIDRITESSTRIAELAESRRSLDSRRQRLVEKRFVLNSAALFFSGPGPSSPVPTARTGRSRYSRNRSDVVPLLDAAEDDALDLELQLEAEDDDFDIEEQSPVEVFGNYIGGVINSERYQALERLCWRASRGNVVISAYPSDPRVEEPGRTAFILYTHGQNTAQKLAKLAESLDAHLIPLPGSTIARRRALDETNERLNEVFSVLDSVSDTLGLQALQIAEVMGAWKSELLKERAIVDALNKFEYDGSRRTLIGEGWIPTADLNEVRGSLARSSVVVHEISTSRTPPTYHRTNKLTQAFQAMVDVYGIARYQEVNPGLPTVITFPFMFAVMFGDIGHGIILTSAALALIVNETALGRMRRDELLDMAYGGRYVLLLMGVFSVYTGFLYNDIFSRALTWFPSGWDWPDVHREGETIQATFMHAYPIGIDWSWHAAENALAFTNSYKMKLSVLLGFVHMTYSLMFSYVNAQFFNSWVDIWGNFVPGLLFMQSIFGYLAITIVYKWTVDWIGTDREPPSLLNMLINMFLSPGTIDTPLYPGQKWVQYILVIISLICVPWLLVFKPLYLYRQNKSAQKAGYVDLYAAQQAEPIYMIDDDDEGDLDQYNVNESAHDGGNEDSQTALESMEVHDEAEAHQFELGDIIVHQVIHTIEFCLNCVSHTASYLRLWALSLAHNQLSSVLWDMTIRNSFGPTGAKGIISVVFLFGMWFVITVVVLVCMEGVSAMLHSLRLHWVEAMSKHFEGEGYAFEPLSFVLLA